MPKTYFVEIQIRYIVKADNEEEAVCNVLSKVKNDSNHFSPDAVVVKDITDTPLSAGMLYHEPLKGV
ncbi:hypothetical protein [Caldanaerobius polysaccharolyticus]|uniref:hypothetical protein n=1 Tax=Caldanaerobius polysaccharolyticus TaxID=44256 RepID=UPI00047B68B2|nr:hypothetical protein [Caldanaerobius polysaccharolyticus]